MAERGLVVATLAWCSQMRMHSPQSMQRSSMMRAAAFANADGLGRAALQASRAGPRTWSHPASRNGICSSLLVPSDAEEFHVYVGADAPPASGCRTRRRCASCWAGPCPRQSRACAPHPRRWTSPPAWARSRSGMPGRGRIRPGNAFRFYGQFHLPAQGMDDQVQFYFVGGHGHAANDGTGHAQFAQDALDGAGNLAGGLEGALLDGINLVNDFAHCFLRPVPPGRPAA